MLITEQYGTLEETQECKVQSDLNRLVGRVNEVNGSFCTTGEWYSFVRSEVMPLLREHSALLGAKTCGRVIQSTWVIGSVQPDIDIACRQLYLEIENIIDSLSRRSLIIIV